jgi:lactate permease
MAWFPYILTAALLVVTRVWSPLQSFLQSTLVIEWTNILGVQGLSGSFRTLYLPGAIFVVVSLVTYALHDMDRDGIAASWRETGEKILPAVIALWFAVATVQIMINSGRVAGVDSMLVVLSDLTASVAGGIYPMFAALVGAFGAFIAGSNTVSDILFGTFQFNAAQNLGVPTQIVVGAQAVGGAIGNLIAIHNVVAALAVVGLVGQEGRVIRLELIPLAYYATATGLLTLLFAYVVAPGAF